MSENTIDATVALLARKAEFCKIIKAELSKLGTISDQVIVDSVSELDNGCFMTNIEKQNDKLSLESGVLPKILKQNPNLVKQVLEKISSE